MKSILFLIPALLGAFVLADDLVTKTCQCPQFKCPGDDAVALCNCLNTRETKCKEVCPKYTPTYLPCPIRPPKTELPPEPKPTCTCEPESCLQAYPDSCYCENGVKQRCYEKCGGPKPSLAVCPPLETPEILTVRSTPTPTPCECEHVACPMIYPQGCYCMNDVRQKCWEKCGGPKPTPNPCPPVEPPVTLTTTARPPRPTPTNPICGGGRGNYNQCPEGLICIKDPRDPGCGPACDGLGICVEDKLCGGFAGFACQDKRKVCLDDPRDDCDPKKGGADCGGLCLFPDKGPYGEW